MANWYYYNGQGEKITITGKEPKGFDVVLEGYEESKKVSVIKVVKNITGYGLAETKELVESKPCIIREDVSLEEAKYLKNELLENGARVSIGHC